jgi:hypothetical protein
MSSLLLSFITIVFLYFFCILLVMKRVMSWKYKALIYGTLTFFMLIGVFLIFAYYDKTWKESYHIGDESVTGEVNNDRGQQPFEGLQVIS